MLTGMAGNMTLASLNTPYSPTSPAKPSSWSFGAASVAHIYDDFQSNVSLKVPHGLSQAGAPTGLGIIYPTDEQKEQQEGTAGSLKRGSSHDMAYKHRTSLRTETIYYDSQFDFSSRALEDTAPEPLNFSSLLYPTELSPRILDLISEEPVIETIQDSAFLVATSESSPLVSNEAQEKWILQRILEASGHSIESLSAELKARSRDYEPTNADSSNREADLQSNAAHPQNAFLRIRNSPVLGINPADIMAPQPVFEPFLALPAPETPILAPVEAEGLETETGDDIVALESVPSVQREPPSDPIPLTTHNLRLLEESTVPHRQESDYEPSLPCSASSSNESAFLPSLSRRKTRSGLAKVTRRHTIKRLLTSPYTVPPPPTVEDSVLLNLPVNYGTPVLDAHRGIELSELKAKAERYRLRNQGQDYDKKWLLSFAGKLTPQGLLTEEYRCYIIGCNQSNRRRDHILIHVGAHLDQRPFACTHCPARFLRKNECKRHELSHTGTRPFACDLCPFGTTAFVRQDLLKRHQKRTHNMDNSRGRTPKRRPRA